MEKKIIFYYSSSGNNKYIANKLANILKCDTEEIHTVSNSMPLLIILSLLQIPAPIKPLKHNLSEYDQIILFGPVWLGQLISPLRAFIKKYNKEYKELVFFPVCGGDCGQEEDKKFDYETIFKKAKDLSNGKINIYGMLPVNLIIEGGKKTLTTDELTAIKLSDENFKGKFKEGFNSLLYKLE